MKADTSGFKQARVKPMRGNANGRNGNTKQSWYCAGCFKKHIGTILRTQALDGYDYCDRAYFRLKGIKV